MHVPIENILSMQDFVEKAPDLARRLHDDTLYVITQNDNPVAAFISIDHLLAMSKDGPELLVDKPHPSAFSAPKFDEKELPSPPKPPALPSLPTSSPVNSGIGTPPASFGNAPLPPKPSPASSTFGAGLGTPASASVNTAPPPPPPPPLPPLPTVPKLDEKSPLVTESEVKQVMSPPPPPFTPKPAMDALPTPPAPVAPKPFSNDLPKPVMPEPAKPMTDDMPKPPPVSSPFSNISSSSINPAPPASPAGTSNPPMWPTATKPEPKPADATDDDLDQGDDIL